MGHRARHGRVKELLLTACDVDRDAEAAGDREVDRPRSKLPGVLVRECREQELCLLFLDLGDQRGDLLGHGDASAMNDRIASTRRA